MTTKMTGTRGAIGRRALGILAAAGLALLALTPAQAVTPEEIKARGKLIVGILTDYPPFAGIDAQQRPAGYDADVSALMAKALGVELEFVVVTGPNRIPYLLTNKVDAVIATLAITPERMKQVLFSNPYSTATIYVLAPKSVSLKSGDDLKSVSVAVARGSSQDSAMTAIAPVGSPIRRFDDDATAFQALVSGQTQALASSNTVLAQLIRDYPQLAIEPKITLREQSHGMGFRRADTALRDWANAFIASIEKSGELDTINMRWFSTPLAPLPPLPTF